MMGHTLEHLIAVVEGDAHDPAPTPVERSLAAQLIELERDERQVSTLRRKLHERLASFPNDVTERRERELSRHRRQLHERIEMLRDELAMLGWESSSRLG